jgi:hypothetical protein
MVHRLPKSDHHDALARWQSGAARGAGLFLVVLMAALAFLFADASVPPQHLPWKPLRLTDPIGVATRPKVTEAQAAACRQVLTDGGVTFQAVPDSTSGDFCQVKDALFINGGAASLKPVGAVMTCGEALAYALWDRQVVQPQAQAFFGTSVVSIDHYGTYSCRRRYGRADQPVSEHAYANALDAAAFHLADGRVISVERDWADPGPPGQFLHQVRDGACRVFGTVLSPDYNAEHHNHLHLDMGSGGVCH